MATRTCGECNGAGYFGRLDCGMTCSACHGNGYINSNRAPDPLSSGSATGGTADSSPAVPPTHSNLPASYEVGHFPQTNGGDDESAHLDQPEYVNAIGRQSQNDVTPAPSGGPNTGRPVQLGPTGFGGSPHRGDVQFSRAAPHSNPVTAVAREASATGQGGAETVTAPPEPDIPTFLDRRQHV